MPWSFEYGIEVQFYTFFNFLLTFVGPHIISIFYYISNKMQRYTVYLYLETALHVFGWYFYPSSGAHTTVSTASCICHTVTAICRDTV
jgi:hypothetical protein